MSKERGRSYNDEEMTTDMGSRSGIYNPHLNPIRPSFFSSNEYNSFIDRGLNFSPEAFDRSNAFQGNQPQLINQSSVNNFQAQEKKMMEDKLRLYEQLYSQIKAQYTKLEKDSVDKQKENDKLITELKTTKITIALLEE
eukprot:CAMPEP_0170567750 /NCGR_PEP_ID=MMETSP0211-20121228/80685_1 /TAXON_ID=311385 /ORGANISM="Pseudokeronopsis sp., Strain OXSARD2" /LENGTH=138 /DNA_ID=CAMNT_0010889307 /DNA_START=2032 /DNA_END=2448 /DNA_ORIENTATION=-